VKKSTKAEDVATTLRGNCHGESCKMVADEKADDLFVRDANSCTTSECGFQNLAQTKNPEKSSVIQTKINNLLVREVKSVETLGDVSKIRGKCQTGDNQERCFDAANGKADEIIIKDVVATAKKSDAVALGKSCTGEACGAAVQDRVKYHEAVEAIDKQASFCTKFGSDKDRLEKCLTGTKKQCGGLLEKGAFGSGPDYKKQCNQHADNALENAGKITAESAGEVKAE